jgi:hypothetical protein
MKPTTANRQLTSLKSVLSKAVTWGLIHEHPLANTKPLKVDTNPTPRFLSDH